MVQGRTGHPKVTRDADHIVMVSVQVTLSPLAVTVAVADRAVVNSGTPPVRASKMPMLCSVKAPVPV